MTPQDILILGGTGKTGRRIARRLRERGAPVRTASRPAFDWNDRGTWEPVLRGATAVYVAYAPDIAMPGAPEAVEALSRVAVEGGTRRLVLLSGRGEEEAQRAEQLLQASGAEWTIVRCSWFAQNFSEDFMRDPVLAGDVSLPVDSIPEPFVDVEDVADVAAAALLDDGHAGEVYELTGARAITFEEATAEIAAASGRHIAFSRVALEDYAAALRAAAMPEEVVQLIVYLFSEVLDGRNAEPQDGVERALRRPAADFRAFAERAAAAGAWS